MRKEVKLTNLQKIYWPDDGLTKGDLITYYDSVSKFILPYLKNRPLSLKRNPNGIRDKGFYHKDAGDIAPEWMDIAPFFAPSVNKTIKYIVCNSKPALLFVANLGCIEMNPWNSTINKPDHPDYLAFDIDPSEKNTFNDVITVTRAVKQVIDAAGIPGFCKTSGSTGIHVYLPCKKRYEYELVRDVAKVIATAVNKLLPSITTMERSIIKRKKNQIYLDYLQNSKGQTLVSAYSVRPVKGACVSAPLEWKEVNERLHPSQFTILNMKKRVIKKGDLFRGVLGNTFPLKKSLSILEKMA